VRVPMDESYDVDIDLTRLRETDMATNLLARPCRQAIDIADEPHQAIESRTDSASRSDVCGWPNPSRAQGWPSQPVGATCARCSASRRAHHARYSSLCQPVRRKSTTESSGSRISSR